MIPTTKIKISSIAECIGNAEYVTIGGMLMVEDSTGTPRYQYVTMQIPVPREQGMTYALGQEVHVVVQPVID